MGNKEQRGAWLLGASWGWGLCRTLGKSRQGNAPLPATVLCPALGWDTLGRGWLIPGAAVGLGVARGPLLIPGASLTPQSQECTSGGDLFPSSTGRDLLPPKMHLRVSRRFAPTPPGGVSPITPCLRGNPRERRRDSSLRNTHPNGACPRRTESRMEGDFTGEARPLPSHGRSELPAAAATRGRRGASPRARHSPDGAR